MGKLTARSCFEDRTPKQISPKELRRQDPLRGLRPGQGIAKKLPSNAAENPDLGIYTTGIHS